MATACPVLAHATHDHTGVGEGRHGNTLTGTSEVVQRIKQILVEDPEVGVSLEEIPDDFSLMEGGLALDSILIAELIARIENRFGLQFDDQVFDQELFENVASPCGRI